VALPSFGKVKELRLSTSIDINDAVQGELIACRLVEQVRIETPKKVGKLKPP
jgi:hypothetical protein